MYSYIIELPPTSSKANGPCTYGGRLEGTGFLLNKSEILEVGKEQHAGLVAMLLHLMNKGGTDQI